MPKSSLTIIACLGLLLTSACSSAPAKTAQWNNSYYPAESAANYSAVPVMGPSAGIF